MRARGLGLWDVYASCRRVGSLDQAIATPSPTTWPACGCWRRVCAAIAHNGGESARSMRADTHALGLPVLRLPSTSPANASWSFDRKLAAWRAAFSEAGHRLKAATPAAPNCRR